MRIYIIALLAIFSLVPASWAVELDEVSVSAELTEPQSTIISAVDLNNSESAVTLSEAISNQPNIYNATYGEVAARPEVRGLSGHRITIMQDNIAVNDVSATSADHATSQMAANSIDQVELLKGSEALKYAPSTGGIIRVIEDQHEAGTYADLGTSFSSNNQQQVYSANVGTQVDSFEFGLSGAYQSADEYEDGNDETALNTDYDLYQVKARLGYLPSEQQRLSFVFAQTSKEYGVPSHEGENNSIDLDQQNYLMKWEDKNAWGALDRFGFDIQYSDYEHAELAGDEAEGLFASKQLQVATEADFIFSGWFAQTRLSYSNSDLKLCHGHAEEGHDDHGHEDEDHHDEDEDHHDEDEDHHDEDEDHHDEDEDHHDEDEDHHDEDEDHHDEDEDGHDDHVGEGCNTFHVAERSVDEVNGEELLHSIEDYGYLFREGSPLANTVTDALNFGWILDKDVELSSTYPAVLSIAGHHQFQRIDLDAKNIEQHWLVPESYDANHYDTKSSFGNSLSVGLEQPFADEGLVNLSLGYYERLPSVEELYWNGIHHATESYDIGNRNLAKEKSINLDIDVQKRWSQLLTQVSGFYYHFNDYIYKDVVYGDDGEAITDPFHGLDVWQVQQTDAKIFGGAISNRYAFNSNWELGSQFDIVRRIDNDGDDLPRTAPMRFMSDIGYNNQQLSASLALVNVFDAKFLAANEDETAGYSTVNAQISYLFDIYAVEQAKIWFKADNIFDVYAQNHISQVKEEAPILGRNLRVGVNLSF